MVIAAIREWELHEVALHEAAALGNEAAAVGGDLLRPLDLVSVVVDACHMNPAEAADFPRRAPDATA